MKLKAFSLAEILIALIVIAIIVTIVLPVIYRNRPDENVIKLRKHNEILASVINELVSSEKYYINNDLSTKPDGNVIYGSFSLNSGTTTTDENLIKYFCNSIADNVSVKRVNCSTAKTAENATPITFVQIPSHSPTETWQFTLEAGKQKFDEACANTATLVGAEIITIDNVVYYQVNPAATFGVQWSVNCFLFKTIDNTGFYDTYKPFCIDVDGIDTGEAPFGYGIRFDGKIITGARADIWLDKKIVN